MDEKQDTHDNKSVCKHIRYSGRVQGVGFRYTAQRLAQNHFVNGYVRNLPGGDVELAAEGPPDAVQSFLDAVAQRMEGYIERTTVTAADCGGYADFRIRN